MLCNERGVDAKHSVVGYVCDTFQHFFKLLLLLLLARYRWAVLWKGAGQVFIFQGISLYLILNFRTLIKTEQLNKLQWLAMLKLI